MKELILREEKGSPLTHQELDNNFINLIPAGAVFHFAMETCPSGYLVCDGSLISRTDYSRLFNAIGTTYGSGDETTTFQLPDLRDIFIRGKSESREIGSHQDDALQNIEGQIKTSYAVLRGEQNGALYSESSSNTTHSSYSGSLPTQMLKFDASLSARTADETRPKNIALLPCIKY